MRGFKLNKNNLKKLHSPEALHLIRLLSCSYSNARFIGGSVRDSLLNREVKDIDIATIYQPNIIIEILTQNNIKTILSGINFGTITAQYNNKEFEITTLREDIETDGRHAKVKYTTDWVKDAERRDFTINSLSYDPISEEIFDYTNGLDDLSAGIVRFIGEPLQRILEDHLRILRYLRFSLLYSKSGFDGRMLRIFSENKDLIAKLSGDRIREEMWKILETNNFSTVIKILKDNNLIKVIFGEELNICFKGLKNLLISEDKTQTLRKLYFFFSNEQEIINLAKKWNLTNIVRKTLLNYLKNKITNFSLHYIKYLLYKFDRFFVIDLVYIYAAQNKLNKEELANLFKIVENLITPIFPLTGKDIIAKRILEGKDIRKSLEIAESMWISSDFNMKKEEILSLIIKN